MIQELVVTGDEDDVREGLQRFFDAGCDEVILTMLPTIDDPIEGIDRTLALASTFSAA